MAKTASNYVCQECGAVHNKWAGQCTACNAWNSIVEEPFANAKAFTRAKPQKSGSKIEFDSLAGKADNTPRIGTGIAEMDRVLGGGLVRGSAILIGGDPGIGKSTLLLQLVTGLASAGLKTAYITGEESTAQVRLRAERLGVKAPDVKLATATSVADILATFATGAPDVIIIDSIQTMFLDSVESAPGTVTQVRASAHELITLAKHSGTAIFLVGHVTKDGQIAGPRVLEHMVDTVLYFEGERGHAFRILRSVKNRFGPANEIGVFEMTDKGLQEVTNPSELFISGKAGEVSGSVIFAGLEGSRPVLVEVQALVAPSQQAMPRRAVVGWDANRLAMILAVLSARCGMQLGDKEVYLNIAGGLRITEPAADMAVAAAIVSALSGIPMPPKTVVFGEVGLSGEARPVAQSGLRLKEAQKLGFTQGFVPEGTQNGSKGFILKEIKYIRQLRNLLGSGE